MVSKLSPQELMGVREDTSQAGDGLDTLLQRMTRLDRVAPGHEVISATDLATLAEALEVLRGVHRRVDSVLMDDSNEAA